MDGMLQNVLLFISIIAGLSGWAAIFAWWLRERTKTVRAIKELRRTNGRLQKTVMFTLDKWRDQVERNLLFLELEREYAEQLAKQGKRSPEDVRTSVRSAVGLGGDRYQDPPASGSDLEHDLAAIEETRSMTETGNGPLANLHVAEHVGHAA